MAKPIINLRIISLISTIVFLCFSTPISFGGVMEIGYCRGEVVSQTAYKTGSGDISAAVILSSEILSPYKGALISGIRLYLASIDNMNDLTVWVRPDLNSPNLDQAEGSLQKGWQTVALSGNLTIDGSPIAIGFTYNQTKASKCIALGGDVNPDGHYIAKKGEWERIPKPQGSVCVELVAEGEQVASRDLNVRSLTAFPPVVKSGHQVILKASVENQSLDSIEGFNYTVSIPEMNMTLLKGTVDDTILPKKKTEIEISLPTDGLPADKPMGLDFAIEDTGYDGNDNITIPFGVYEETYPRTLLLEEFTSEYCDRCPRAIQAISTALSSGYDEKMVVVAHHVGYYPDWLTIPEESDLVWLYGDGSSYAPAVMYDRTIHLADTDTPVEMIGDFAYLAGRLEEVTGLPGFVGIEVTCHAEDGTISADVESKAHPLLSVLLPQPRLSVLITESGIPAHRQAGNTDPAFTHSHASRAYLTEVFGDEVEFDQDGLLHWSGTVSIHEDWNPEHLKAVAFINAYDPLDRSACQVFNVASASITAAGVGTMTGHSGTVQYFDLHGHALKQPCEGVTIIRKTASDGKVRIIKSVR